MRLLLLGILCASACAFDADVPGEGTEPPGDEPPGAPVPNPPAQRCTAAGMEMCIDFEGDPLVTDAFGASTAATNVSSVMRDGLEQAAQWSGSSSVLVGDTSRLDNASFTIELWTKPAQVPPDSGDKQVGLFDAQAQYQLNYEARDVVECRFFDVTRTNDDKATSQIKLGTGRWHHVACTYDGHELRVYVDGRLSGCRGSTRSVSQTGSGAAIGANLDFSSQLKNRFVGDLDNVHLYSRALGATEICEAWGYGNCSSTCPTGGGEPGD